MKSEYDPREVLAEHINPTTPRLEIVPGEDYEIYRAYPGFAPSDLKLSDPELGYKTPGHPQLLVDRIYADQQKRINRAVPVDYEENGDTPATSLGRLYHTLLLEPERFFETYVVFDRAAREQLIAERRERKYAEAETRCRKFSKNWAEAQAWKALHGRHAESEAEIDEIRDQKIKNLMAAAREDDALHPQSQEFRAWKEAHEKAGREVVPDKLHRRVVAMIESLQSSRNRDAMNVLADLDVEDAQREVSIYTPYQIGKITVQLKGRIDIWGGTSGTILDGKTCQSVSRSRFSDDVEKFGHFLSAGAYAWHLLQHGHDIHRVGFLAQEKRSPYRARVGWMSPGQINYGATRYLWLATQMAVCWEDNDWEPDEREAGNFVIEPSRWQAKLIEENHREFVSGIPF